MNPFSFEYQEFLRQRDKLILKLYEEKLELIKEINKQYDEEINDNVFNSL